MQQVCRMFGTGGNQECVFWANIPHLLATPENNRLSCSSHSTNTGDVSARQACVGQGQLNGELNTLLKRVRVRTSLPPALPSLCWRLNSDA